MTVLTGMRWYLTVVLMCISLNNEWCWASFHVFVGHLYIFLWRSVCLDLLPMFWLGSFFWYWAAWAACMFCRAIISCFVCSYFLLFWRFSFPLAVQKLLCLTRSHWFIFVFISITLGGGSKRTCCNLCQSVLPMFSSKSFIGSGFMLVFDCKNACIIACNLN